MNTATVTAVRAQALEPQAFAPYGEIILPRSVGGQFADNPYDPETSREEPKLVLTNGTPRLWLMAQRKRGLVFTSMARHRRVSQCLGAMQGRDWFIAVAPPNDLADGARPDLDRLAAFRIPGDRIIKLNVATWHAGPHFVHDDCLFLNLENLDTNKRDFDSVDLPNDYRIMP